MGVQEIEVSGDPEAFGVRNRKAGAAINGEVETAGSGEQDQKDICVY